ncbi:MAG: FHA domain-containing protein [Nannocystaceae bacterium]
MNKQLRKFECRDDVWARVEALAASRKVSTDEIVQNVLIQAFSRKRVAVAKATGAAASPSRAVSPPASARRTIPALRDPSEPPPMRKTIERAPRETPDAADRLYISFAGKVYVVDDDEFLIGRAPRICKIAIKDANISRKHCKVVRRDGQFFINDLGSTNGVEYDGKRVNNHRIIEGAVYRLCDHELHCSYVAPS